MVNENEAFLALFGQLKARVNDSPVILGWLSEQKSDVRKLAYLVGESGEKIQKSRAESSNKHRVVPRGFLAAWEDYENRFAEEVKKIYAAERKAGAEKFISRLKKIAASEGKDPDSFLREIVEELESKKEKGDSFNPLEDDPVHLIYNNILMTYEDVAREILSDDQETAKAADKAIGAWNFFSRVLGVDHGAIYKRWKQIPELLIPSHALRVDPQPMYELYNEAIRSYIFGNRIAAITIARALMEHILSKHYNIREDRLDNMITIAEGRYRHFQKMRMHDKRKLANLIMHQYEKKPHVEDEVVIQFLTILQALVRNIPRD